MEQILTPINIGKGGVGPTPGFRPPFESSGSKGPFGLGSVGEGGHLGPTLFELDPYFSRIFGDDGANFISNCDYNVVINNGEDANLKKNQNRTGVSVVRTQALRGPLIISGWGFDVTDRPVPSDGGFTFDPRLVYNRAMWKTGPVHLMWDDERQVWCGGHQVLIGSLASEISPGTTTSPSTFKMDVARFGGASSGVASLSSIGEEITVVNRDAVLERSYSEEDKGSIVVVAIRLNYEWVPIYVQEKETGGEIYLARYSGGWSKGEVKTIEDTEHVVLNLFNDLAESGWCAYARIAGSNFAVPSKDQGFYLIAGECPDPNVSTGEA